MIKSTRQEYLITFPFDGKILKLIRFPSSSYMLLNYYNGYNNLDHFNATEERT